MTDENHGVGMSTVKVWGLGDAVVDLLPEKPGTLLQCPGGAPANVAVGVARLGGLSGFVGCVGDNPCLLYTNPSPRDTR